MLERHAHLVEVAGEHAAHQLRVARLAEARRARDVAEHDVTVFRTSSGCSGGADGLRLGRGGRRSGQRQAAPAAGRKLELRVVDEDRPLQPLQGETGLEAELLVEQPACVAVGLERRRLAAGAVQGEHQLSPQALAERLRGDDRLQLGDELAVAAEREVGVDPVLERGEPQLREAGGLGRRERLLRELGERRAAPERERLAECRPRRPDPPRDRARHGPPRPAARSATGRAAPARPPARIPAHAS